ncbi:MAG: hypothetical protein KAR20_22010, partial [Candidatus Heimdallarchaeota archaeon]|nr:hypothetical protein [Candidatus Heimdallarchaeota archaeon]
MHNIIIYIFIVLLAISSIGLTQDSDKSLANDYFKKAENEAGAVFAMTETGSGFGGFMLWPISSRIHVGATLDAFFLRDSRQVDLVDPYTGYMYTFNKQNNVYIFDLLVTIKRRFFAEDMDDSFRPFLSAGIGPTFGLNSPEDDTLPNEKEWTIGGFVGGGVDITV